jgi:hypothetical protein
MRQFLVISGFVICALALAACGSEEIPIFSAPKPDAASAVSNGAQKVTSSDPQVSDIICPKIELRSGTETLRNFEVGTSNNDADLTWQATITNTARECSILGAEVGIKAGVSGRVLLGPKGKPGTFSVPVRLAVIRNGTDAALWSRVSNVNVTVPNGEGSAVFTAVVEDILFPREANDNLANVQIYAGFDPHGAVADKPPKGKVKGKR